MVDQGGPPRRDYGDLQLDVGSMHIIYVYIQPPAPAGSTTRTSLPAARGWRPGRTGGMQWRGAARCPQQFAACTPACLLGTSQWAAELVLIRQQAGRRNPLLPNPTAALLLDHILQVLRPQHTVLGLWRHDRGPGGACFAGHAHLLATFLPCSPGSMLLSARLTACRVTCPTPPTPATHPPQVPRLSSCLQAAPEAAILVLHACGHNPTGVDVSQEQWAGLLAVAQRKRFLVLWDVAYQVRWVCTMGAGEEQGACSAARGLQAQLLRCCRISACMISRACGCTPSDKRFIRSISNVCPPRRALCVTWRRMWRGCACLPPPA